MLRRKSLVFVALGALLAFGSLVFAQEKTAPPPAPDATQGRRAGRQDKPFRRGWMGPRGRFGKMRHRGLARVLHQLNLTDAQRQQLRAQAEKFRAESAPQRAEARRLMQQKRAGTLDAAGEKQLQQFRADSKARRQARHNELLALLTPEQKAQLEQFQQRAKERSLNLTDAQREQIRTLHERFRQTNAPKFEEMRRLMQQKRAGTLDAAGTTRWEQLRAEFKTARDAQQAEFLNLLTPEQKAKVEQRRQFRFGRGGGMMRPDKKP